MKRLRQRVNRLRRAAGRAKRQVSVGATSGRETGTPCPRDTQQQQRHAHAKQTSEKKNEREAERNQTTPTTEDLVQSSASAAARPYLLQQLHRPGVPLCAMKQCLMEHVPNLTLAARVGTERVCSRVDGEDEQRKAPQNMAGRNGILRHQGGEDEIPDGVWIWAQCQSQGRLRQRPDLWAASVMLNAVSRVL